MNKRLLALVYGAATHLMFLAGVGLMFLSLYSGMQGIVPGSPPTAFFSWGRFTWNLALVLHFPVLHSLLLAAPGRALISGQGRSKLASQLTTTTFACIASLQLIVVFSFWLPTGTVIWEPPLFLNRIMTAGFFGSWLLLGKSMWDSDITLQTGLKGWLAVFRGRKPVYQPFPTTGLYQFCRQPIYLSFLLILISGPHWTLDRTLLAFVWGSYCVLGAVAKEHRFQKIFGADFKEYQRRVPFFLPQLRRITPKISRP